MRHVGNERVIATKELKKYYDKLGSYLHAPTVQQEREGSTIPPEHMRKRCHEVLSVIDEVLASTVYAVDFRVSATMACQECGTTIICRMPTEPGQGRDVSCTKCIADYRVEPDGDSGVLWKPLMIDIKCGNPDCKSEIHIWRREVEPGAHWTCSTCGGTNRLALGVHYSQPDDSAKSANHAETKS